VKINRSAPAATVVPVLVYRDVGAAVAWLCRAFGFVERLRVDRHGVVFHAQLGVGDGAIMMGREGAEFRAPRPGEVCQYVHVTVDDVDAHYARARASGADIVGPPADKPFGERQYTAVDPEGHRWTFSQHIDDVLPETWGATVATKNFAM
jgi:uncharacterized glyoxalase superfamily protein PhnB